MFLGWRGGARRCVLISIVAFSSLASVGLGGSSAVAADCSIDSPSTTFERQVQLSVGHARVWRLYQAFFLRQPDQDGFNYWIQRRSQGASLGAIAYQFAQGPEFTSRYGALSDAAFVDLVYRNVLCRTPDGAGRQYWATRLGNGDLTRWDLMINFAELREYLDRTRTCHSIYPDESRAVAACGQENLRDLSAANLSTDGYQRFDRTVARAGGSTGSFSGVEVLLDSGVLETGADRCAVASINGNWLVASEKDRTNPGVLGVGVIDGRHAKNSSDRTDRGVFGLRFDPAPTSVVEVWPGDTLSDDDTRLNSVAHRRGPAVIESWHASAESSPYLRHLAPTEIVASTEWVWAAAGIPLIVDGQTDADLGSDIARDPYTYSTTRHTFVAIDQDTGRAVFAGTSNLAVIDFVRWAEHNGYEDLIKFDGGGSAEFNVARQARVAGTNRDVPVWIGIGC